MSFIKSFENCATPPPPFACRIHYVHVRSGVPLTNGAIDAILLSKNIKNIGKTNHVRNALRSVQSDVFHCRENIRFLLSLDLLSDIEGDTEQSTSFGTVPEIKELGANFATVLVN